MVPVPDALALLTSQMTHAQSTSSTLHRVAAILTSILRGLKVTLILTGMALNLVKEVMKVYLHITCYAVVEILIVKK